MTTIEQIPIISAKRDVEKYFLGTRIGRDPGKYHPELIDIMVAWVFRNRKAMRDAASEENFIEQP